MSLNFFKSKKSPEETLCVLPWIHLFILPSGKVLQCCNTSDYINGAGDINEESIEEIWNGKYMKSIRKQMMQGVEPKICCHCFDNERAMGTSLRNSQNRNYPDLLPRIPEITKKNGYLDKMDLKIWDFRFSNLCNYKCRMCNPDNSSAWVADYKKLGWPVSEDYTEHTRIESVNKYSNTDFIKKYIDSVEQINFAGGESLIIDEHWQILDLLDKNQRYDVRLGYNSNMSVLKYKDKNVLDYWVKWGRRLLLMASVDEFGPRAELIRSGTKWGVVEANLKAVNEIGIELRPYITVSAMNVFRLPEILDYFIEIGIIKQEENWMNFELNVLYGPPKLHVSILPDEMRRKIKHRLEKYITNYQREYNADISRHFQYLFTHLNKPWQKKYLLEFRDFSLSLDKIRDEDTLATIPELVGLFDDK